MESTAGPQPLRLVLVGSSEGFARSLARYLSGDARVALAGVAPGLVQAGRLFDLAAADLALLDWTALGGARRDTLHRLRAGRPGLRIAWVVSECEAYRDAAAQSGADAVVSADEFAADLESMLREFFPQRYCEPA